MDSWLIKSQAAKQGHGNSTSRLWLGVTLQAPGPVQQAVGNQLFGFGKQRAQEHIFDDVHRAPISSRQTFWLVHHAKHVGNIPDILSLQAIMLEIHSPLVSGPRVFCQRCLQI